VTDLLTFHFQFISPMLHSWVITPIQTIVERRRVVIDIAGNPEILNPAEVSLFDFVDQGHFEYFIEDNLGLKRRTPVKCTLISDSEQLKQFEWK